MLFGFLVLVIGKVGSKSVCYSFCLDSRKDYMVRVGDNHRTGASATGYINYSVILLGVLHKSFYGC